MKFTKVMLGIGVGILAALFIGFLIEAIYPTPKYEDYCKNMFYDYGPKQITNQTTCGFVYNTTMRNNCSQERGMVRDEYDANGCITKETCDYCDRDFMDAEKGYNRQLFYITAPIGLVMIILGLYLPASVDAIAGGILFGGILTMMQITMRVFGNIGKWPRVILLGVELVIIIWIGVKKVSDTVSKKKKK